MAGSANNTVAALQRELAKYINGPRALDPRAVEGIASHEGLSGGIGDNGTSFGPFQLHWGGAYPGFAPHGSSQAANAWAWSPQGIDYALNQIQSVAGGRTGLDAISNISRRFERPADPASEIADAARHYGIAVPNGSPIPSGYGGAQGGPGRSLQASSGRAGYDPSTVLGLLSQVLRNRPATLNPWGQ